MLREEFVECAAAVHGEGARFLRDSAAAILPCCGLFAVKNALLLERAVAQSEMLMERAIALSAGLWKTGGLTKHTATLDARMRLLHVETDETLTRKQTVTERTATVPPGTRGEVYDGFVALSERGEECVNDFLRVADDFIAAVREGRAVSAVPLPALQFLHRLCADYGAACAKLRAGEEACLLCRADQAEKFARSLRDAVRAQGVDAPAGSEALAACAASGMIPCLPPVLFDVLVRYERIGSVPALRIAR